jgi:F0F1-type ATP synthase assembly protein I
MRHDALPVWSRKSLWRHALSEYARVENLACEIFHKRLTFAAGMANDEGGSRQRPTGDPDQERDIARRRDALLAEARGEKGPGGSQGGADPRLMGLGLQFVVAILLCLYAGMWLDARLHTAPWLMLIGALIGASAGFYTMFRVLMSENKRFDAEDRQHKIDKQK